ncbi:MAG: hypothetical protein RIB93_01230 [Coleofasciculus sp. D1-CHI-01]|uniref:hypothetical protein n=1 Tax=Coleofasciculus sp. D1-CHI-01 TaxID=3068482 RepID=UPI003302AA9F
MQEGRPYQDRLFSSGQLNRAIACSLRVNSMVRSQPDSKPAPIFLVPSPSRGRLGRGRVKVLVLLIKFWATQLN